MASVISVLFLSQPGLLNTLWPATLERALPLAWNISIGPAVRCLKTPQYFHHQLQGFERFGLCTESDFPYQDESNPKLAPSSEARKKAEEIGRIGLRAHWIKPWSKKKGLSDEHLRQIKQVLAYGYPVAAGSHYSLLLVGYTDDLKKDGGGSFITEDSKTGAFSNASYKWVKDNVADVFWVQSPTTSPGSSLTSSQPAGEGAASFLATASVTGDKPYENSLGMRFVPVPITGGQSGGKMVLFSVWETRVKDYEAFINARKSDWIRESFQQDDHPAMEVNWNDAVAFCNWLTEEDRKKGKISKDEHYRLPTDHEWSCAAGIGKEENAGIAPSSKSGKMENVYPWGSKWPPPDKAGNFHGEETKQNPDADRIQIFGYDDGFDRSAPVGTFTANEYGLYDLSGNVWEWCKDGFSHSFTKEDRVMRGGSWSSDKSGKLLSSNRWHENEDARANSYGFRCVLVRGSGSGIDTKVTFSKSTDEGNLTGWYSPKEWDLRYKEEEGKGRYSLYLESNSQNEIRGIFGKRPAGMGRHTVWLHSENHIMEHHAVFQSTGFTLLSLGRGTDKYNAVWVSNRTLAEARSQLAASGITPASMGGDVQKSQSFQYAPAKLPPVKSRSLAKNQALIKGLAVQLLQGDRFASKSTQMNATVSAVDGSSNEMQVKFNQDVGSQMQLALKETIKHLRMRNKGLPRGVQVEISFEDKYGGKDGPSAAVACTLMLQSLIDGTDIDPLIAVTGDMSAEGVVKPVGGIEGKVSGAYEGKCQLVAIPSKNEPAIRDLLVMRGPGSIAGIQVFSVETFYQAKALARTPDKRNKDLQTAIETFVEVQDFFRKKRGVRNLNNPYVVERLRKVLKLAPNHLSAKYLLLTGLNRAPKQLSLIGSVRKIDVVSGPMIEAIKQKKFNQRQSTLGSTPYGQVMTNLRAVRSKLDPRTLKCVDAITVYANLIRTWVNSRPKTASGQEDLVREIKRAEADVRSEHDFLFAFDVNKELLK